jgi:hypothetical protein
MLRALMLTASLSLATSVHAEPAASSPENPRVDRHLRLVAELLHARSVTHLDAERRATRERLLSYLDEYIALGKVPEADGAGGRFRVPVFVDRRGVFCAVAYLMVRDGQESLVRAIAARDDHVYADRIADEPDLGPRFAAWVQESGLDAEELALIQPTYGPNWGKPPPCLLCEAIEQGDVKWVDRRARDDHVEPTTVLRLAARLHGGAVVKWLLEAQPRGKELDPNVSGPWSVPGQSGDGSAMVEALQGSGSDAVVLPIVKLLLAGGAWLDTPVKEHGRSWTPLLHAIASGRPEIVSYLLAKGADVNRLVDERTALDVAQDVMDRAPPEPAIRKEVMRVLIAAGGRTSKQLHDARQARPAKP